MKGAALGRWSAAEARLSYLFLYITCRKKIPSKLSVCCDYETPLAELPADNRNIRYLSSRRTTSPVVRLFYVVPLGKKGIKELT